MSNLSTKPSDPAAVDAYLKALDHPAAALVQAVRKVILTIDRRIGEEIKWNAPAFFYTGPLVPFDPKEYRRHLVVFNLFRKDRLRLIFWHGDRAGDTSGWLEGNYPDGRRLAPLANTEDLAVRRSTLARVLKAQLQHIVADNETGPRTSSPTRPKPGKRRAR